MSESLTQIDNETVCPCILHAMWMLEFHVKGLILLLFYSVQLTLLFVRLQLLDGGKALSLISMTGR